MISESVVDLSRFQFAMTAMYHFIFVPLTLGLAFILAIMETTYVISGKEIYKDMTKFWGKLFGINFALGVTTGLTMEFQFGTNWAYYSHYVGDIFGAPLAIEGLMAFFLESTFIGLFFFGWDRLSKVQHLCVTWLVALGSNMSALWILVANGWMQNPVGYEILENGKFVLNNFQALFLNPWLWPSYLHNQAASMVTSSFVVAGIGAFYILSKKNYSKYTLFLFIDCLKNSQFLIDFSFASLVFSLYASFLLFLSCLVFIDLASTLSHFTLSYKELAITVHILLTLITVHLQHRLSTS